MRPPSPRILLILLLCLVGVSASLPHAHQSGIVTVRNAHRSPAISLLPGDVETAQFIAWTEEQGREITAYLDALEQTRLAELAAVEAEAARQARQIASQTVSRASGSTVTGGDCAPVAAIVGWGIVNRESGGNPGAVNPSSGAIGCSQTLPSHYNQGGICAGLNMYTVAGQTECTQRLYNAAGLSPWAG